MKKIILFLSLTLVSFSFANSLKLSPVCAEAQVDLAEGDVVFISNHNYLFRQLEEDTKTWTSHVGIIFKNDRGDWVTYESTWPKSKITPFCEFLDRSFGEKVEIRRLKIPLNYFKISVTKKKATSQLGLLYDQGFDYNDQSTSFCSKFVYNTYNSVSVKVGVLETFQELFERNSEANRTFWETWFMGDIPLDRLTVTPASQIQDPQFYTVYGHNND